MDFNEYVAAWLIRERLAEARALAARTALIASIHPPRRALRKCLGNALIRLGRWIAGSAPQSVGEPDRAA